MTANGWIGVAAAVLVTLGLVLLLAGRAIRRRRGLGGGKTVSLDRITRTSTKLGLTGRPDRLIHQGGMVWPEEWKSSRQVRPWHRNQLGVYFLLIEEQFGMRPLHGFIVTGDGTRHQIDNDDRLRTWVLELAGSIRAARREVSSEIPVNQKPWQCRPCGMHGHCMQARL